jgi:hypothetical protein
VPPQPHGATCVRVYVQARSRGYSSNSSRPFPPHCLCAPAPPGVLHHDAESPDPTVELVTTDPLETVRDLKAEDGPDIGIVGSGTLAHALLPQIDQPSLKQHSAVIGVRNSGVQRPVQPADVPANQRCGSSIAGYARSPSTGPEAIARARAAAAACWLREAGARAWATDPVFRTRGGPARSPAQSSAATHDMASAHRTHHVSMLRGHWKRWGMSGW